MKQLENTSSDNVSHIETKCTEQVNNLPVAVNSHLPNEMVSMNSLNNGIDETVTSVVSRKQLNNKSFENNEPTLDSEDIFTTSLPGIRNLVPIVALESGDSNIDSLQNNIENSEFNQSETNVEEDSSNSKGVNPILVSDTICLVTEEDNTTQLFGSRTSSSVEESSSLKDEDVLSTDHSRAESTDNSEDTHASNDGIFEDAVHNKTEHDNRTLSSETDSVSCRGGDIQLMDFSKTDSTDNSDDMNNQEDSMSGGEVTDSKADQETTFTHLDCDISRKCHEGDSILEDNVKSNSTFQPALLTDCNQPVPSISDQVTTVSPVHFQKKAKKMENLRTSARNPPKRKKRSLEVTRKDDPIVEVDTTILVEDNSSPMIANGLLANKHSKKHTSESLFTKQKSSLNNTNRSDCLPSDSTTEDTKISVSIDCDTSDSELSSSDDEYNCRQKYRQCSSHTLNILVILATIIAIVTGVCLRSHISSNDYRTILYLRFPGQLFTNVLQMLAVPLIVSGLISNLASLKTGLLRRVCLRTLFYYFLTSFMALATGVILALTIQPGMFNINLAPEKSKITKVYFLDVMLDLFRNMFPDNVIVACFKRSRTEQLRVTNTKNITTGTIGTSTGFSTIPTVSWTETNIAANTTEEMSNSSDHFQVPESGSIYALPTTAVADVLQDQPDRFEHFVTQVDGINVLGLVMYSLLMSLAIRCMGEQGQILTDILTAFYQCTLKLIYFISWYSPIGIFFLFTAAIIELQEPSIAFRQLALYTGTALVANLGYCLMLLPLVYYLMTHKNPRKFFYKNSLTLLTSFATTCNLTTLPVMLQCAERRVKLHHQVTRIILPLGAILNTSAGALYKCVACIFMAQYEGVSLTIGKLIIISITSAFVSIGTRNLPQNGNIGLLAVLTAANIPTENISLILAADWILNRISVTVNTMVDIVGAGVIHHLTSINKIN